MYQLPPTHQGNPYLPIEEVDPQKEVIKSYIRQVFGSQAEEAIAIATCESGLNPYSTNWGDAKYGGFPSQGIFQIHRPLNQALYDWKTNIDIAYHDYYLTRGFTPWSCWYHIRGLPVPWQH